MDTRSGEMVSAQIGKMGVITGLDSGDFTLPNGQVFNIKNDGTTAVELDVVLAGMDDGESVVTTFEPGWNPEIVRCVKRGSLSNINLKYGY